jgi:hypothetical protein
LDVDGIRVGYVPRWLAASLFPAVLEANKVGLCIRMRARTHTVRSWLELMVRSSNGADLRAWLRFPQEVRGTTFFEPDWTKPGRQFAYQDHIAAVIGDADESQLFDCDFVPSDCGPDADIYVAGNHVGQVREFEGGQRAGLARFHRRPDNIEMKVVVPLADGALPRNTHPFVWNG